MHLYCMRALRILTKAKRVLVASAAICWPYVLRAYRLVSLHALASFIHWLHSTAHNRKTEFRQFCSVQREMRTIQCTIERNDATTNYVNDSRPHDKHTVAIKLVRTCRCWRWRVACGIEWETKQKPKNTKSNPVPNSPRNSPCFCHEWNGK